MQARTLRNGLRTVLKEGARGFDRLLEQGYYRLNLARSRWQVRRALSIPSRQYARYLGAQLDETLRKKRLRNRIHFDAIPLIDLLARHCDIRGKSVLCIGCRNRDELLCFRKHGAADVVGIDLFSDHPDILVMDMHELRFPDRSFDVVYSRHSFEHAFDKGKAAREFVRVLREPGVMAIEVPGNYRGGADCNVFAGSGDVLEAFVPHVGEILYEEYSRKEANAHKMDIIRLIFRVAEPGARPRRPEGEP